MERKGKHLKNYSVIIVIVLVRYMDFLFSSGPKGQGLLPPPVPQASFSHALIADRIIQCVHSKWHWLLETLGFKVQAEIKGSSFSLSLHLFLKTS